MVIITENGSFGLLGEKLRHSYSPTLHAYFADYGYDLYETAPEDLEKFMRENTLDGFNVTIPYKKAVIPYLCGMSEIAEELGSVNTVIRTKDGLYGHNTDYDGFAYMLNLTGFDPSGKKALVLGNGGACPTVCAVLRARGAFVTVISRRGEDNYDNLEKHADAALIVNTTPVGMYPNNLKSPLSLDVFERLECVLDIVFNPFRTALLAQAEARGIKTAGGISMLVAQAKRAAEIFTGSVIPDSALKTVTERVVREKRNVILVGMPGSGKTTLGRALAEKLGRTFVDTDDEIVREAGMNIPEIFDKESESGFRIKETETIRRVGAQSALVIATGGGAVTREDNYLPLAQNGVVIFIRRELSRLARDGRPISMRTPLEKIYNERLPMYERFADAELVCVDSIEENVNSLMEIINEIPCNKRT